MLPRPKISRVLLIVVPLVLVALLWNAARGRPRFVATPEPAQSLALSHDGTRLAFTIQSDEVLWGENGKFHKLPLEYSPGFGVKSPAALQFSRDGNALLGTGVRLLANKTPAACQWDLRNNRLVWSVTTAQNDRTNSFMLTPDGKSLAQISEQTVKVFDLRQKGTAITISKSRYERAFPVLFRQEIKVFEEAGEHGNTVSNIAISKDGSTLILAETTGVLEFWDVAKGKRIGQNLNFPLFLEIGGDLNQLKPSPDGRFVAICNDTEVVLWDKATGRWTRSAPTSRATHDLVWMSDSRSLWTSGFVAPNSDADKVKQLSVPDLKPLRTLPAWGPFAISGDGRTIATRDNAGKGVWLWNIE